MPSPTFEPTSGAAHPVLSALGERQAFARRPPSQQAEDWAHSAFVRASSPKRQPLVAEPASSPPRMIPPSPPQQQPEELRGGFRNTSPAATSPRLGHRNLVRSPPAEYQRFDGASGGVTPRGRRISMPVQHYHGIPGPVSVQHGPQMAAYHSRSSSRKVGNHDFYTFDTLPPSHDDPTTAGAAVLLISAHQSLYAYTIGLESLEYHGHIEGLRGRVLAAHIIPTTMRHDKLRPLRPLVVVVIHGPFIPQQSEDMEMAMNQSQYSAVDPSESVMQAMQTAQQGPASETQFQTTVELYSLKERQHVATLFRSPVVDVEHISGERFLGPPSPVGALSVHVKGRFIVVASAISGEVYIYATARDNSEAAIRCIGKTWTTVPTRKARTWSTSSAPTTASAEGDASGDASASVDLPILSLSQRWLAVVSPVANSKTTLHGSVDVLRGEKDPPGFESSAPSSQPGISCELDTPLEDSRLNRVARDVAQEMLKGAQWVGAQGMQAWKNYWSKPTDQSQLLENPPSARPTAIRATPTGEDSPRASQGASLVSILDLERLAENQSSKSEIALQPIATFPLPNGCSHLSFSPNGLNLLTASTKGDVQYVWDLMRMVYPRSETFAASTTITGPLVRQVARFTRVTQAHIIDVVWTEPRGERLAILTDRGTVHLHDIPTSAYIWPPPRAKRPVSAKSASESSPPASGWGATLSSMTGRAQPILAAARDTRIPSLGGLGIGGSAGRQGTKMVATGFSKSVGAATGTVNSLRHMGESRLSVPITSTRHVSPGSVRWIAHRDVPIVAVVGDRKLQFYSVISKPDPRSKTGRRYAAVGMRLAEHKLPAMKDPEARLPCDGILLGGWWPAPTARAGNAQRPRSQRSALAPLSYAELESCAPFQPIHADRRVTLKTYDRNIDTGWGDSWVFGGPISAHPIASSPPTLPAVGDSSDDLDFMPGSGQNAISPDRDIDTDEAFNPGGFGFPEDETEDMLGLGIGIASIMRAEGAMRADGAGPASVTLQARPVKKKKARRGKEREKDRDTAQGIIEGFGHPDAVDPEQDAVQREQVPPRQRSIDPPRLSGARAARGVDDEDLLG